MTNNLLSGLDMQKTLDWYSSTTLPLPAIAPTRAFPYPLENPDCLEISSQELSGLFSLFPKNARERSILRKVVGKPSTWFSSESTPSKPLPTTDQQNALSLTAIIPSYTDYTAWGELKVPAADIWLYQIPFVSKDVRTMVLYEGFVHELGHTIIQPALYCSNYHLRFPNGKIYEGLEAMFDFASLAEKHLPISHYASTYRGKNNKFESEDPTYDPKTPISEELCETIAAYFLGFSYCDDEGRNTHPFDDRLEIKEFVHGFLHAELVRK